MTKRELSIFKDEINNAWIKLKDYESRYGDENINTSDARNRWHTLYILWRKMYGSKPWMEKR